MTSQLKQTRDLNTLFRTSDFTPLGHWMFSDGVLALGREFVASAVIWIMEFDQFDDPTGLQDFGKFVLAEHEVRIEYVDRASSRPSPDPSDFILTCRFLTILLASEF